MLSLNYSTALKLVEAVYPGPNNLAMSDMIAAGGS